jgi:hypothetical protein
MLADGCPLGNVDGTATANFVPNYVQKALKQFQHKAGKLQYAPYQSTPIQYGAKKQYATQELEVPLLDDKAKRFIQQVCGKFLFLSTAVHSTILCPISAIASQSSKPTEDIMQQTLQLLDYLATQEDAVLLYHASDMVLAVHSDTSYLSEPKARSQAGGHYFLSSDTTVPPNNGAILNIAHIIKNVMSSATETELAELSSSLGDKSSASSDMSCISSASFGIQII